MVVAKWSKNHRLSLNLMSLNRDCTVLVFMKHFFAIFLSTTYYVWVSELKSNPKVNLLDQNFWQNVILY